MKRDNKGRFANPKAKRKGLYICDRGYWRFSSGPNRGKREHRVLVEEQLGRPLAKDEDINHRDLNKLNNWLHADGKSNLEVLGHKEHGAVSAKQHWWAKTNDFNLKSDWDSYMDEEEKKETSFNPSEFGV